jgi:hypothetical protein
MTRWHALRPTVAIVSALAVTGATVLDLGNPLRGALVAWFLLACPGLAAVALLRITDPLLQLVASIAVSLALGVAVAESLLYLDRWSPRLGLLLLVTFTLASASISLLSSKDSGTCTPSQS